MLDSGKFQMMITSNGGIQVQVGLDDNQEQGVGILDPVEVDH